MSSFYALRGNSVDAHAQMTSQMTHFRDVMTSHCWDARRRNAVPGSEAVEALPLLHAPSPTQPKTEEIMFINLCRKFAVNSTKVTREFQVLQLGGGPQQPQKLSVSCS